MGAFRSSDLTRRKRSTRACLKLSPGGNLVVDPPWPGRGPVLPPADKDVRRTKLRRPEDVSRAPDSSSLLKLPCRRTRNVVFSKSDPKSSKSAFAAFDLAVEPRLGTLAALDVTEKSLDRDGAVVIRETVACLQKMQMLLA